MLSSLQHLAYFYTASQDRRDVDLQMNYLLHRVSTLVEYSDYLFVAGKSAA